MRIRRIRQQLRLYKRGIRKTLFIIFLVLSILYLYFMRVFPALSASASSLLNIEMNKKINDCCLSYFDEHEQKDLVEIAYGTDMRVTGINVNVNDINRARFSISRSILNMLNSSSINKITIPIGCIFNSSLIYGRGPRISLRVLSGDNFRSRVESMFTERGINQTLFEMYITFEVTVTLSMPLRSVEVPISTRYLLAETVIVGDVPEAFTDINRTFDDITESEIDDINDFGAQQ